MSNVSLKSMSSSNETCRLLSESNSTCLALSNACSHDMPCLNPYCIKIKEFHYYVIHEMLDNSDMGL